MAVGESYPVIILNANGDEIAGNTVQFTDSTDQPLPNTGAALSGTSLALTGLTGAVTAVRYVGGTATVAPTTGTFVAGDFVVSVNGSCWVCTVGGTPGTWVGADSVLLAPKASPTFTGVPAAPTAAAATSTTQLATTAFVDTSYAPKASPTFTGTVTVPAAAAVTSAPKLADLSSYLTVTSGTLPVTGAWASATAKQNPVTRDITMVVEFVTDASNNLATCLIAISADNSTYTSVGTLSLAQALNNLGAVKFVSSIHLPQAWWIKLTFAQGTVAASSYY